MKVKGPIFIGGVVVGSSDIVVDLSVSTADLIAELEKWRPGCLVCEKYFTPECHNCIWGQVYSDKFKGEK